MGPCVHWYALETSDEHIARCPIHSGTMSSYCQRQGVPMYTYRTSVCGLASDLVADVVLNGGSNGLINALNALPVGTYVQITNGHFNGVVVEPGNQRGDPKP